MTAARLVLAFRQNEREGKASFFASTARACYLKEKNELRKKRTSPPQISGLSEDGLKNN
jgi:hypothetical protein